MNYWMESVFKCQRRRRFPPRQQGLRINQAPEVFTQTSLHPKETEIKIFPLFSRINKSILCKTKEKEYQIIQLFFSCYRQFGNRRLINSNVPRNSRSVRLHRRTTIQMAPEIQAVSSKSLRQCSSNKRRHRRRRSIEESIGYVFIFIFFLV